MEKKNQSSTFFTAAPFVLKIGLTQTCDILCFQNGTKKSETFLFLSLFQIDASR